MGHMKPAHLIILVFLTACGASAGSSSTGQSSQQSADNSNNGADPPSNSDPPVGSNDAAADPPSQSADAGASTSEASSAPASGQDAAAVDAAQDPPADSGGQVAPDAGQLPEASAACVPVYPGNTTSALPPSEYTCSTTADCCGTTGVCAPLNGARYCFTSCDPSVAAACTNGTGAGCNADSQDGTWPPVNICMGVPYGSI